MARGYPDFFGPAAFQGGGPYSIQTNITAVILAGEVPTIFKLTDKSIIRGGTLHLSGANNPNLIVVWVTINGIEWLGQSLTTLFTRKYLLPNDSLIHVVEYDPDGMNCTLGLPREFPIVSSYILDIENVDVANCNAVGYMFYSPIL